MPGYMPDGRAPASRAQSVRALTDTATRTGCCSCARERCLSLTTELFERREVGGWRAPFFHPLAPSSAFG